MLAMSVSPLCVPLPITIKVVSHQSPSQSVRLMATTWMIWVRASTLNMGPDGGKGCNAHCMKGLGKKGLGTWLRGWLHHGFVSWLTGLVGLKTGGDV